MFLPAGPGTTFLPLMILHEHHWDCAAPVQAPELPWLMSTRPQNLAPLTTAPKNPLSSECQPSNIRLLCSVSKGRPQTPLSGAVQPSHPQSPKIHQPWYLRSQCRGRHPQPQHPRAPSAGTPAA